MKSDVEPKRDHSPVLRRGVAGLVLLAVAALIIHAALHLILYVVIGLVAVVAVLWALNAIL
jgi:hypothetical protein